MSGTRDTIIEAAFLLFLKNSQAVLPAQRSVADVSPSSVLPSMNYFQLSYKNYEFDSFLCQ